MSPKRIYSRIIATGSYLPKNVVTNHDLAQRLDTSHEWIVERTGIHARHIAGEDENTTSMGIAAARQALQSANLSASDIEMVIVATCTPDKMFPSTACLIQEALGISQGPAFDVAAACTGFVYALSIADQFIRSGQVKTALVVGAEVMSRVVDWEDRSTCVLFGDGAGCVVLSASDKPGILSTHIQADGQHKDSLFLVPQGTIQMEGNKVFRMAVNAMGQVAEKALQANDLTPEQVDWVVPHQANIRIIQTTMEKLNCPMEKVIITLDQQGNTSAASVPLALDQAVRDGRIKENQTILLEAMGGGLTWGSALLRF